MRLYEQGESVLILFIFFFFYSSCCSLLVKHGSMLWLVLTVASLRQGHVCFMSPSDSFYLQGFPCSLPSKPSSLHRLKGNSGTARCKESIPVAPLRMVSPAAFFFLLFVLFCAKPSAHQDARFFIFHSYSFSCRLITAALSVHLHWLRCSACVWDSNMSLGLICLTLWDREESLSIERRPQCHNRNAKRVFCILATENYSWQVTVAPGQNFGQIWLSANDSIPVLLKLFTLLVFLGRVVHI